MSPRLSEIYPHAFLTGASTGLGRAFAVMLLEEGVRVWGTARDAGRLTDLAARFPTHFTPVSLDLADPLAAEAAFARAANYVGGCFELAINNAGYGVFGDFQQTPLVVWQGQIEAMLGTTLRLNHAALAGIRKRGHGCIVNVSSLAVEFPLPFMSGYNVAKAGLSALCESLIIETRGSGIKVVDFRPGDFRTRFNRSMLPSSSPAAPTSPSLSSAWNSLEKHLEAGPEPVVAASDLRRTLLRGRIGIVRSGSFFQARVAPVLARFIPDSVRRSMAARYYAI